MGSSRKIGGEAVVNSWKLFEHERQMVANVMPNPLLFSRQPDICVPNRRMVSDIVTGKLQDILGKGWMNVAMAMPAMPCLKPAKPAGGENDQTFLFLEAGTYAICYCSLILNYRTTPRIVSPVSQLVCHFSPLRVWNPMISLGSGFLHFTGFSFLCSWLPGIWFRYETHIAALNRARPKTG
jgi:hypothetical protein